MKTIIGCTLIFLSLLGADADASNANQSKKNSSLIGTAKKEKLEIEDAADYLKSYPVNKIESGMVDSTSFIYRKLPPVPLEKWITSIIGDTPLEWKEDGCAEYDSDIDENSEHCASFLVNVRTPKWHCPEVNLSFDVRNDGTVYFLNDNSIVNDFGAKAGMQQIAELEEALKAVKKRTTPDRPSSLPAASLKAMTDNDMIAYVRTLDVHALDSSLPSERFDKWLERTARWPLQWWQQSALEEYHARCEPKRIVIRVTPAGMYDPEHRTPPFDVYVDIGSWERGIESEPKLTIYFKSADDVGVLSTPVQSLSALKKKLDEWNAALKKFSAWNADLLARKSVMGVPVHAPVEKKPVVQNMTKLGYYSRVQATPGGHCYGLELSLWKYGERVFGTLYDLDGQCADSHAPTYTIRDVKYDAKTGDLEFWSYGTPGYKFVGKMDQNKVVGEFLGMYEDGKVKLKRGEDQYQQNPDADRNVEVWCKDYAPDIRYIVKDELETLCKSMGVQ